MKLTRTEYCLPARIQGDSVSLKNISAGSSRVFNCMGFQLIKQQMSKNTHEHKYRPVLALSTPVLCGMSVIADPIRLSRHHWLRINNLYKQLTLMPHRKGAILVPTTGSWCIAIISGFVRISRVCSVAVGSLSMCERKAHHQGLDSHECR